MHMRIKRAFIRFMIFALGGMLGEVFYHSALKLWSGNLNMHGYSSPWMMIDYGLIGLILMPMAAWMVKRGIPLPGRAFFYMLLIYFVEYVSGIIFTWGFGLKVWDYTGIPYNLHGQIMLYSAPIWYALGLVAEYLYRKVDAVAALLLRDVTAEQIEAMDS